MIGLGKFFAALSSCCILATASGALAEVVTKEVLYKDGEVALTGYLAYDATVKTPRPGVLVVHEWWGLNEYAKRRTRELAALGYVAFAADVYGGNKVTTDPKVAGEYAKPFYTDKAMWRRRLRAALDVLSAQGSVDAKRLGAMGYCFGGSAAVELARSGAPLLGVVSFHGGLKPSDDAKNIKGELLILNGEADPMVPVEERLALKKELDEAKVPYIYTDFSGALHAFTNPEADSFHIPGIGYQARADHLSWENMRTFFARLFGPTS